MAEMKLLTDLEEYATAFLKEYRISSIKDGNNIRIIAINNRKILI